MGRTYRYSVLLIVMLGVSACSEIRLGSHFAKKVINSDTQSVGQYKVGNPYTIDGVRYYPKVDYGYNETGIASWYGPGFDGERTANGETFHEDELTAAHKTLPLPSIVQVTNLENGKRLIVRVNDRGPYARGRVIDMSKRCAELLGFVNQGTARVRVQVLEQESRKIAQAAMRGEDTRGVEVAMNDPEYAAENSWVNKVASDKPASTLPADMPKQTASLSIPKNGTIPGHIKDGVFYPDPVMSEVAVQPTSLYVQVASFSSRENAMKLSSSLRGVGRPLIHEATVGGKTFYRVRVPAKTTQQADNIINALVAQKHKNPIIVVE